ncbi:MAG: putative toxin-antitoxin system toxin component, PIN family [Firmicutes bacterium]|nr:putative toxin-antitoxin system toxin component, PIN family [Bacillota bacterium]
MKVVLDTNVLVSGLLKAHSSAGMIVRLMAAGLLQVVYDGRILAEYRQVLTRPRFGFREAEVEALISQIETDGILAVAQPLPERLPDPDDEPFLEVALAVEGAILVTGNKKHFRTACAGKTTLLDPGEFIALWRERARSGHE